MTLKPVTWRHIVALPAVITLGLLVLGVGITRAALLRLTIAFDNLSRALGEVVVYPLSNWINRGEP